MHHLSGGPSPTASAKQGLRIKNLAYSAFVACALAASLPNQATIVAEHPNLVNWGQLASTASIVAFLSVLCLLHVFATPLYEAWRVPLESFYLIGLCTPFVLTIFYGGCGVRDVFYQAIVHLWLIPFIDLPVSSTLVGTVVLGPLYLHLDWRSVKDTGVTLKWSELLVRQAGCVLAWVGGMGLMHTLSYSTAAILSRQGTSDAATSDKEAPRAAWQRLTEATDRIEDCVISLRRKIPSQDRTLLLFMLFILPTITCFVKCIRPFFDKHGGAAPGPFELYIAFMCMYLLGTLEVEQIRGSLARKLQISQDLLCDLLPSHVVKSLLESGGPGRSRAVSPDRSLDQQVPLARRSFSAPGAAPLRSTTTMRTPRESDSVGGLSPMHRVSSVASVTTAAWASARSSSEANNQTLPEAPSHGAHAAPLSPLRVTSKGVMGTEAMDTNDAEVPVSSELLSDLLSARLIPVAHVTKETDSFLLGDPLVDELHDSTDTVRTALDSSLYDTHHTEVSATGLVTRDATSTDMGAASLSSSPDAHSKYIHTNNDNKMDANAGLTNTGINPSAANLRRREKHRVRIALDEPAASMEDATTAEDTGDVADPLLPFPPSDSAVSSALSVGAANTPQLQSQEDRVASTRVMGRSASMQDSERGLAAAVPIDAKKASADSMEPSSVGFVGSPMTAFHRMRLAATRVSLDVRQVVNTAASLITTGSTALAGRRDWAATDSDSDFHGPAPSRIDSVVSRLGSSVILGQNSAHTDPDQPSDTQANSMATKTVKSASAGGALISNRSTRGLLEGGLSSMFSSYSGVMAAAAGARGTPLPSSAVASHWTQRGLLAEVHDCVSVIFMDLVGFTSHAQMMSADAVMRMLDTLYCRLDDLCLATGNKVYKVETIGDSYMAATGLMSPDPDHAITALHFALAMRDAASEVMLPTTGQPLKVRIGIHSGRAMSGIVGKLRKRYCLFGDTINCASRMESTGLPNRIHISDATYQLARNGPFTFQCRGEVAVKGKGQIVTYFAEREDTPWLEPSTSLTLTHYPRAVHDTRSPPQADDIWAHASKHQTH